MHKYLQLLKLSWQQGLVYRTSLILWRLRQVIGALIPLALWGVLFTGQANVFGYSRDEMVTYIFLTTILQSITLTSALNGLSSDIYAGAISHLLLKPVKLWRYFWMQDVADKLKNVGFALVELLMLFVIFRPTLFYPHGEFFGAFLFSAVGGFFLLFLVQLLFGSFGFWSPETWGPRFLFFMMVEISSGRLFPLDILPSTVEKTFYLTPFPYFTFVQSQIYLGRLSSPEVLQSCIAIGVWIGILILVNKYLWQRGLRDYQAAGQ